MKDPEGRLIDARIKLALCRKFVDLLGTAEEIVDDESTRVALQGHERLLAEVAEFLKAIDENALELKAAGAEVEHG